MYNETPKQQMKRGSKTVLICLIVVPVVMYIAWNFFIK